MIDLKEILMNLGKPTDENTYFMSEDFKGFKYAIQALSYVSTLPEDHSKGIVIKAFEEYYNSKNFESRFSEIFITELKKHADDPLALCVLGEFFYDFNVKVNDNKIVRVPFNDFRERAAANGNPYSAFMLGKTYLEDGFEEYGVYWLKKAVIGKYSEANYILAKHYMKLKEGENLEKAKRLLSLGAYSENAKYQRKLGEIFSMENNKEECLKWFERAALGGDGYAQCYLGDYYFSNNDLQSALKWHKRSADNQNKIEIEEYNSILNNIYGSLTDDSHLEMRDCGCFARRIIEIKFLNPKDVSKFFLAEQCRLNCEYETAIEYFKSIANECEYSGVRLANIYETIGKYDEAIYWNEWTWEELMFSEISKPAFQAANRNGHIYFEILKKPEEAILWYKKSAIKGNFEASMILGDYYVKTEQYDEAIYWYSKFARELTPINLGQGCGEYDISSLQSEKVNSKLSKLLYKLGNKEMAKYYYYNSREGMKDANYHSYIEKIGGYDEENFWLLYNNLGM